VLAQLAPMVGRALASTCRFGAGKLARGAKIEGSAPSGAFAFEQEGRKGEERRKGRD
jgi:hypothetical protein